MGRITREVRPQQPEHPPFRRGVCHISVNQFAIPERSRLEQATAAHFDSLTPETLAEENELAGIKTGVDPDSK